MIEGVNYASGRFEAWLKGLGLDGEIISTAKIATCGGSCEFIFKIVWSKRGRIQSKQLEGK